MLLKTQKGMLETNSNELQLSAQMREPEPEFVPFDIAHVSVAGWDRGMQQGSKLSDCASTWKYKNSGNELKKWFKTNDITFFDAANYAHFGCNSAQVRA